LRPARGSSTSSARIFGDELLRLTDLFPPSHTYQLLPLIPVEEFVAQHPEHADADEDTLMVARINHERAEREALEQQRLELQKRKQKLIAENKKRRDDLANLDKDLEKFIDVSYRSSYTAWALFADELLLRLPNPSRRCSRRLSEVVWA
jgi:hypothetical protein